MEGVFGDAGASALCRQSSGRRRHERCLPRVRHFPQDRLQNLQPLQGSGARCAHRSLAPAGALCQPAAGPDGAAHSHLKRDKPHWGARKIRELLVRRLSGDVRVPARSTIHAVLDRHGLVNRVGKPTQRATGTPLSAGAHPNDLWCTDFKGEFKLGNGHAGTRTIENVDRALNPYCLLVWRGTPHAHANEQIPLNWLSRSMFAYDAGHSWRLKIVHEKEARDGPLRIENLYAPVRAMAEAVKLYQEIGFPALQKGSHDKKLVGYFQADTGTINQIVHLWKFDDDADRRAHWAAVYANKDFVEGFASKFRPLLMTQEVKLLQAAPWGPHP